MRCSWRTVGSSDAAAAVPGREASPHQEEAAAVPGRVPPVPGRVSPVDTRPVDGRESPGPLAPLLRAGRADAGTAPPWRGDAVRAPKLVVAPRAAPGAGSGGSVAETGSSSSASAESPALRFARRVSASEKALCREPKRFEETAS